MSFVKQKDTTPKTGLAVREFGMTMHMSMDKVHLSNYSGYLDYPGHPMDGKRIVKSAAVPKNGYMNFGKSEVTWMVEDGTDKPPVFPTVILLMAHYNLKPITR